MSKKALITGAGIGLIALVGGLAALKSGAPSTPVTPLATPSQVVSVEQTGMKGGKCISVGGLPDAICTPGAVRTTDVNSICHGGSTKQYRPPTSYTNDLKTKQMIEYGFTGDRKLYEEDHLISIELGGDPKSPLNLWPEAWDGDYGAHKKDAVENRTHALVCSGKMDIVEAQTRIAKNWIELGKSEGIIK